MKPRACVLEHGLGIFRLASKTAFYTCVPTESQGLTEILRAFEVTCKLPEVRYTVYTCFYVFQGSQCAIYTRFCVFLGPRRPARAPPEVQQKPNRGDRYMFLRVSGVSVCNLHVFLHVFRLSEATQSTPEPQQKPNRGPERSTESPRAPQRPSRAPQTLPRDPTGAQRRPTDAQQRPRRGPQWPT